MKKKYAVFIALLTVQFFNFNSSFAQLSGLYTINSGSPTAGNNFASFTALATALNTSGISGPVTVNVVVGSLFNGQVLFAQIAGVSATQKVIINGNSSTLTAAGTSGQPWTLGLNGADFMVFNNLVVVGTGTSALTCHLYNNADNNVFNNCNFRCPVNSTITAQVPFSISGSLAGAQVGGPAGNNNLVRGCTISGGFYATMISGNTSAPFTTGNQLLDCHIMDFYCYGVRLNVVQSTTIKGCLIDRPNATISTNVWGIALNPGCEGTIIDGNRIVRLFAAIQNATVITTCIHLSGPGTQGNEIVVRNNLIAEINSIGSITGIYTPGSQYINLYHNTISLDDVNSTATAGCTGILHSGLNTFVKNNIISISRGGSGIKYGLYYGAAMGTGTTTADNNFVYISPSISSTAYHGYHYASGAAQTYASWILGTNMDLNGGNANPIYMDPAAGNYMPQNAAVVDKGVAVGVLTDLPGQKRSLTTPDPGAFESVCNNCTIISGKFFGDCNTNCIFDPGDVGLGKNVKGRIYNASGYDLSFSPDATGSFSIVAAAPGPFSLTHSTSAANYTACFTSVIAIPQSGLNSPHLIGYKIAPYYDPAVNIVRTSRINLNGVIRVSVSTPTFGSLISCGAQTPVNPGKLKIILKKCLSFDGMVSGAAPTVINANTGDTLVWEVADFFNNPPKTFSIAISPSLAIGKPYVIEAMINPSLENFLPNNNFVLVEPKGNPMDPNNKLVYAEGMLDNGDLVAKGKQELFYTINFQNVGTAPAVNVVTLDTMDVNLDLNSLRVLQRSFPVSTSWRASTREVAFMFNGIYLPDSNANEPLSHGFVRYGIMVNDNVPLGTVIKNRAHNYFDFNDPVATNQAQTKLVTDVGIKTLFADAQEVSVIPNPFDGFLQISSGSVISRVQVYDMLGRFQKEIFCQAQHTGINLEALAAGIYIIRVELEEGPARSLKVIKN